MFGINELFMLIGFEASAVVFQTIIKINTCKIWYFIWLLKSNKWIFLDGTQIEPSTLHSISQYHLFVGLLVSW